MVTIAQAEPPALTSLNPVKVGPLVGEILPHQFFKTRQDDEHLYIWEDFISRILVHASQRIVKQPAVILQPYILNKPLNDSKIQTAMSGNHLFRVVDEFLYILASLLKLQPRGEPGILLNNGYANLFYVQVDGAVWVVFVHWFGGNRRWYVRTWEPDEFGQWSDGRQAFSRNG